MDGTRRMNGMKTGAEAVMESFRKDGWSLGMATGRAAAKGERAWLDAGQAFQMGQS